nr:hypothetical protein [Microbacterium bovistercoris]
MESPRPPRWPTVLIAVVGALATVIILIWAGATYDDHGNALIDEPIAKIFVALIGGAVTLGAMMLQRTIGQIKHQVKNSHKVNMRDDLDDKHDELVSGIARLSKDMGGIRRDIGRLGDTDHQVHSDLSQLRREFAEHVTWSQKQAHRIDDIEDTVDPRKKES